MSSTRMQKNVPFDSGIDSKLATDDLEQLWKENAGLQAALVTSREENALLNEVISTIGSTLNLEKVLTHLVSILIRAISCHAAFIYLYDKEKDRLVLASTSEQYQHHVGKIELALGEGINGWVALTLQPIIIQDDAMADPRFQYFPDLEEEKFQSVMTVPITGKDRNLIGVIALHSAVPHEFTEQHQTFASTTAALVAGAIENAQLYQNTQRKLRILTSLSVLSQTISSSLYLDEMLRSLATLTMQIMEADLCVIMLLDAAKGRLVVRAAAPHLNDRVLNFQPIDVERNVWERLREVNELAFYKGNGRTQPLENTQTLERLNPLKDAQYKMLHSAPLIAGAEHLGFVNCYSNALRRYSPEDQTLLSTIANQAAMAIKNSHLVDLLAQKNMVKSFFDELMFGPSDVPEGSLRQKANFLGCDLTKSHAIAIIEISRTEEVEPEPDKEIAAVSSVQTEDERLIAHKRISSVIRRRLADSYPGSLLYEHENLITSIICLTKDPNATRLKTWLRDLCRQMGSEHAIRLSIGVGNPCQHPDDYRRGYVEANEALQMGQHLNREAGVTHFNDLGVYRYLYKIAQMDDLRDMYQDQVAHIANYDRRKGTDLLDTLEIYLESAGNLTKTSNRLFVHRNTLIQRLERLQSLCEIDLQERSNWLTLQVAIKVYKLRASNL